MNAETASQTPNEGEKNKAQNFELVTRIIKMLEPLSQEEQKHILETVITWLNPSQTKMAVIQPIEHGKSEEYPFSGRTEISVKQFMLEKEPKTDLERLTCLGYYLTHYRQQPHFKTEDITKLNMEAAQPKFSNAAFTAKNAVRDGYLVQAPKQGMRQLSALGEQYVQALPDHEAARLVRSRMRGRRVRTKSEKVQKEATN